MAQGPEPADGLALAATSQPRPLPVRGKNVFCGWGGAVPEPATYASWTGLVAAFGVIGCRLKRRASALV